MSEVPVAGTTTVASPPALNPFRARKRFTAERRSRAVPRRGRGLGAAGPSPRRLAPNPRQGARTPLAGERVAATGGGLGTVDQRDAEPVAERDVAAVDIALRQLEGVREDAEALGSRGEVDREVRIGVKVGAHGGCRLLRAGDIAGYWQLGLRRGRAEQAHLELLRDIAREHVDAHVDDSRRAQVRHVAAGDDRRRLRDEPVDGQVRRAGERGGAVAGGAASGWACWRAAEDAGRFEELLRALQDSWRERLRPVRRGSAADLLLRALPGAPLLTVTTASDLTGRSTQAFDRIVGAGILTQVTLGRRNRAFEAPELIAAFTALERQLASPEGDTLVSEPIRRVPRRRR